MAKVQGYFPTVPNNLKSGNLRVYERKGDGWESRWASGITNFPGADRISAALSNRHNMSSSGYNDWHYGPFSVKINGELAKPIDKFIISDVVKVNNKPFLKRVEAGHIVVSDFKRFQAHLQYSNGVKVTSAGDPTTFSRTCWSLQAIGFKSADSIFANSVYVDNNTVIKGNFDSTFRQEEFTDDVSPYDVGWDDFWVKPFLDRLNPGDDNDVNSIIMSNTGSANKASVDLLTTLAELPETFKMLMNLVKSCLKIYKDSRRKEFTLLTKEKRVRLESEQRLNRFDYETRQLYLAARNARSRRIVEKRRARDRLQLVADIRKTLNDLADAVSSVWLQFRYGIMPNVYTIEGIAKSFDEKANVFLRFSEQETVESIPLPQFDGWTSTSKHVNLIVRAFIKRKFDQITEISGILKNYTVNMLLTAWELIPLSFVIDWFINIGNVLSSAYGSSFVNYTQAATFSVRCADQSVTYTHVESKASVQVEISGYKRTVINPDDYCRLVWKPDLTPDRMKDAFALSWQLFLKKIIR